MASSRLATLGRFYVANARLGLLEQLQYRTSNVVWLLGMIAEPVVYLVVWRTVAMEQGGAIGGYQADQIAAYYIVWTLVRGMNITFTPFGWEYRIRNGQLSSTLARPIHPFHYDLSYFAGWKVVVFLVWLPVGLALTLAFRPALDPTLAQVVSFLIAIWLAYVIRTCLLFLMGLVTFWTTRVVAFFELVFAFELILSGRLIPLPLLPERVQTVASYLPFASTFGFPITTLVGPVTNQELIDGLATQVLWIVILGTAAALAWRPAVKRFSAVSG